MNENIELLKARDALENRLKYWWKERRLGGNLNQPYLSQHKDEFLKENPRYEKFRRDLEPYYVTVPGSFIPGRGCYCGEGEFMWDRAKVRDVKVKIVDWDYLSGIASKQISDEKILERSSWLKPPDRKDYLPLTREQVEKSVKHVRESRKQDTSDLYDLNYDG